MVEHKLLIVGWLNGLIRWIAGLFGLHLDESKEIVSTPLVMSFIVTILLILVFKLLVKGLSVKSPTKVQYVLEMIYKFFTGLVDDMIGHEGRRFVPVLATMGLFITVANLIGLLPEMGSPTASPLTPAACTLFVVIYYHSQGVRKHGFFGYLKTLLGPVPWLAWLFLPIELITHFIARPLSLTMRLFGNIFGEDLVIIIIAMLVPFVAPLPIMALAIFTSFLQAFIFVMLSTIYLAGAIAEEH